MLVFGLLAPVSAGAAVSNWEVTPYQVNVWLAVAPETRLGDETVARLISDLARRGRSLAGAAWQLQVERPPAGMLAPNWEQGQGIAESELQTAREPMAAVEADKFLLLKLRSTPAGWQIAGRELDLATETPGPLVVRNVGQPRLLSHALADVVSLAIVPVVELEPTEAGQGFARLKAGGLIRDAHSPALLKKGDVLRPVMRYNDRLGRPRPGGLRPVEWTWLEVVATPEIDPELGAGPVPVRVVSGMRNPLGGRISTRIRRLAVAARATGASTRLELRKRAEPEEPLVGYDVYADSLGEGPALLLGATDWQGGLSIRRDALPAGGALATLYVKHGGSVLARLPVLAGWQPAITATLPDDDARLAAEGFVQGFQQQLVDLVARRELLAAAIRRRIAAGELEQAATMILELRAMSSQAELLQDLQQQRRLLATEDEKVQLKIDSLLGDTRKMIATFLDGRLVDQLRGELEQAKQSE